MAESLQSQPFSGLMVGNDNGQTFLRFDSEHEEKEQKKKYLKNIKSSIRKRRRAKPRFAFILQAFDGDRWKIIRKDGHLISSKSNGKARSKEFVACLQDGGFVSQMKVQIYGNQNVSDKQFFSTPVRWRRIDAVSHV
tara:strand:- start:1577 stop:1987 length:411 start_codon:yes stop_codon:yes gene_type:complete